MTTATFKIHGMDCMEEVAALRREVGTLGVSAATIVPQMSHLSVGAEAVTIAFQRSWILTGTGIVVSAVVGILVGLAPGWHAARTEIVSALWT